MCHDSQDVMGEKPVKNDAGQLSLDEEAKKEAWREHYERLLNVEFPWNPEDLSEESPVEGPSEPLPWRWSQRPSAKWHLAKQPDHQVLSLRCWSPLGKLTQWRCVISLRTSSRRDAFQLTGRKASLSICTRAKGMLWIEATTGAWSWLSKWHGLHQPGESIWSSSTGCHLEGNAQTRNWRVAGASGPVHVQGCEKQGKSRRWVQRGVWCWSGFSSGLCP